MPANFYNAACDNPQDSFEQITRRLLGIKGFTDKSAAFKQECRKAFESGRRCHRVRRGKSPAGENVHAKLRIQQAFDGLLKTYVSLDESAVTIVRQLKKTLKPGSRRKIIAELRSLENRRLELLDQIDSLGKSR